MGTWENSGTPAAAAREQIRLLVATTNAGKLREIRALLEQSPVDLIGLVDVPPTREPDECGDSFQANARIKACGYAEQTGLPTVAEDSGLEIDALGGEPGIHSARFLTPEATYPERFAEIYRRLAARPGHPRTARFVCALAVVDGSTDPHRVIFETAATIEGIIADAPSGTSGFGYDPIFLYPPCRRTLAEISQEQKLAVAHRGQAFRQLAAWLEARR